MRFDSYSCYCIVSSGAAMSLLTLSRPLLEKILGGFSETVQLLQLYQCCATLRDLAEAAFESRLPTLTHKVSHSVVLHNEVVRFDIDHDYEPTKGHEAIAKTGLQGFLCRAHDANKRQSSAMVCGREILIRKVCIDDEADCRRLLTELRTMRRLRGCELFHTLSDILIPPTCHQWWREVYLVQPAFACDMGRIIRSQQVQCGLANGLSEF